MKKKFSFSSFKTIVLYLFPFSKWVGGFVKTHTHSYITRLEKCINRKKVNMLGKVKVLLSATISYIISSDESVEAVNVSASRRLLLDIDENVTQENEPFPNANGLLCSIPEHEATGQKDTDNNLEVIEGLLENDLINNILNEPNAMVDLEVGVHENQYANADIPLDNPPNEVPSPNADRDERRTRRNVRYTKYQKKK